MYLISKDLDSLILEFFYKTGGPTPYKHNTVLLGKIYKTFGGTTYKGFVTLAKDIFFSQEFNRCGVLSIEPFIGKLIHKSKIKQFDCYRKFMLNLGNDSIVFASANRRVGEIVKFLSLYHGYRCSYSNIRYFDKFGYTYYDFHDLHRGGEFTYKELRVKRVHNPKYYDLLSNGLYKLKEDAVIYKVEATSERVDITCIKCI